MRGRLLRYWAYFRRGHSTYLVLALSFLNFVVIQYRLLVRYIPALSHLFSRMSQFAAAFTATYVAFACLMGWIDYKRGSVEVDSVLLTQSNPYTLDMTEVGIIASEGFLAFLDGDLETARAKTLRSIEMRERWRRR